jgi:hypothetical protein
MALRITYDLYLAAQALHHGPLRDTLLRVVRPLTLHVRSKLAQEIFCRQLLKNDNIIDRFECRHKLRTSFSWKQRSAAPFQSRDGVITIDPNDQHITLFPSACKIPHVPNVQQIEAPIRKGDATSLVAQTAAQRRDFPA